MKITFSIYMVKSNSKKPHQTTPTKNISIASILPLLTNSLNPLRITTILHLSSICHCKWSKKVVMNKFKKMLQSRLIRRSEIDWKVRSNDCCLAINFKNRPQLIRWQNCSCNDSQISQKKKTCESINQTNNLRLIMKMDHLNSTRTAAEIIIIIITIRA